MSLLNTINSKTTDIGLRAVIMGTEKVGKTTISCNAPRPLLIPLESGYGGLKVHKTDMVNTYPEVKQLVEEIIAQVQNGEFPFKTLIFDSATALERQIHQYVIDIDPKKVSTTSMETTHGGYGKGHTLANTYFAEFLELCDQLANYGGINIIFTCHVFADKIIDPAHGEYDTWNVLLHSPKNLKTYGKREMISQWADVIGYLYEPMYVTKEEGGTMSKGMSANKGRVLGIERTPAYVAGNRYGMTGEISIPKEAPWNALAKAIQDSSGLDFFNRD